MPAISPHGAGILHLPGLDIVTIKHAILVAECLSFRRAARVLGVTPSALARRMTTLEELLGVLLFQRHRSGVRLTEDGARFLDQVRLAVINIEDAVSTTGRARRAEAGRVRIGILSSMANGFLRDVLATFRARYPDVEIDPTEEDSSEHTSLVRRGRLDVAFMLGVSPVPECHVEKLWTERVFVALPDGHPLCLMEEIEWSMLRDQELIVCQSEKGRALRERAVKRFAEFGASPRLQPRGVTRESLMHLVAVDLGVALVCEGVVATPYSRVAFRPIAGGDDFLSFSAVWLSKNDKEAFRRFRTVVRDLIRQKVQQRD